MPLNPAQDSLPDAAQRYGIDFDTELHMDDARAALERLLAVAESDTGQSRRVANFLLAWWNAGTCGGFDLTDLWSVDREIVRDMFLVMRLVAAFQQYPHAYVPRERFEQLLEQWRPHLVAVAG